jgi:Lar family restriction alleviation protein
VTRPLYCPFCGSTNVDDTCTDTDSLGIFAYVFCNNCDTQGPPGATRDHAVDKWNRRHAEAQHDEGG